MHNIWEFLLQTLSVSAAAALLLIVKALLADKLPPRWQYGVWAVLALCLCRFVQGIGLGGEWSGAALVATENAPANKRALYG